jgi:phosphate transport system protein
MFANLSSFWKGGAFLTKALEEFKAMLDSTETMYGLVRGHLLEGTRQPDLEEKIRQIDKGVNDSQRDIRKRIIEHLSLQPTVDVNACLLLMSVVKDAERLGDYAKNLYEVAELFDKPMDIEMFRRYFDELDQDVSTLFQLAKEAFVESDETKAKMTWGYENKIAKWCDNVVKELAKSDLSVNEAVCFTLIARFFKRTVAHLANIATSVVLPLSDLDYFDEKRTIE